MAPRDRRVLMASDLILCAGPRFITAQSPPETQGAGISGRVLAAATSKPIMGALVTVTAPELPGGRSALSDERGFYRITGLPAGRYTIVGSKPGYLDLVYGQRRPLMEGEVIEALRNRMFRIQLDNGHETLGYTAGKMRRYRIRIFLGDRVKVELSPYDLTRGRIVYRYR